MTEIHPDNLSQIEQAAASGRNVASIDIAQLVMREERPLFLERNGLVSGEIPSGGTEIVLQRHGKYIRDKDDPEAGSLTDEAVRLESESATTYFNHVIEPLTLDERESTFILFVASDTAYAGGGKRSYETASIAQDIATSMLTEKGIPVENILNLSRPLHNQGAPRPMAQLREPQLFDESPDFVAFMKEKYGDLGKDFWIAFEEDTEKEARQGMGAEGPDEIADRMKHAVKVLSRYASLFHLDKPDSRLIIWASTHYDTISPFVKRDVLHKEKSSVVLVDYGGGVTIDLGQNQTAVVNINNQKVPLDLEN